MKGTTADFLIKQLSLRPHPEGGFFTETYRSEEQMSVEKLPGRYKGSRSFSTAIYFLLTADTFSCMHRLQTDELFHFYGGYAVEMLYLSPDGSGKIIIIGTDIVAGQSPQFVVEKGIWQGCRVRDGGSFALLGCTVAPGFDFADYEEGRRDELSKQYSQYAGMIAELTRK